MEARFGHDFGQVRVDAQIQREPDDPSLVSSSNAPTSFPGDVPPEGPVCDSLHPENCLPEPEPDDNGVGAGEKSMFWDAVGIVPGIGNLTSAISTGVDLTKAGFNAATGDTESAKKNLTEAGVDAVGSLPIVGNLLGAEQLAWDTGATGMRSSGVKQEDAPTFAEAVYKGLPSWSDIISPFTDPNSWTPGGPVPGAYE